MTPPTVTDVRAWPATVALWPDAASVFGISRTAAYELARRNEFPVRVLRLGRLMRCCTAELLAAIGATCENDKAPAAGEAMTGAAAGDVTRPLDLEASRA